VDTLANGWDGEGIVSLTESLEVFRTAFGRVSGGLMSEVGELYGKEIFEGV
jgi:hypothetical protein